MYQMTSNRKLLVEADLAEHGLRPAALPAQGIIKQLQSPAIIGYSQGDPDAVVELLVEMYRCCFDCFRNRTNPLEILILQRKSETN